MKYLALLFAIFVAQAPVAMQPQSAQAVVDHMLARNDGLNSYTAHVKINAHAQLAFIQCSLNSSGTAYFKRPGSFAVSLSDTTGPCASQVKSLQTLSTDVGNPRGWERDWDIALGGTAQVAGKPAIELILTKKIPSDQVKNTLVFVDPSNYELVEMVWNYTNGDAITMTQSYATLNGYSVVVGQHFDGKRRVRFTGDSTYDTYQMNVAVNDAIFNQQP
jgi:hypothetical protein